MYHLKSYKLFESNQHIIDLCNDCLIDVIQMDDISVNIEFNTKHAFLPNDDLVVSISTKLDSHDGYLFDGDIKDSVNHLISMLSSNHYELSKIIYSVKVGDGFKWNQLSLDSTSGQVSDNGDIEKINYKIHSMKLLFHEF